MEGDRKTETSDKKVGPNEREGLRLPYRRLAPR